MPAHDKASSPQSLPPEALRTLDEVEECRQAPRMLHLPPELNGRMGPEPPPYDDWELNMIVSDF